jgi:hypothetical protein
MKSVIKAMLTTAILLAVVNVYSQAGAKRVSKSTTTPGTSVALSLKNMSDNKVTIFAGPRDELSNPKTRQKVYEGQSTNTVYASVNEVVCILGADGKPVSCIDVMPNAEELEVDNSGTKISSRE